MSDNRDALDEPDIDLPASGCLDFLLPALPVSLVGEVDRRWLRATAALLPPIPRIALELRLGGGKQQVDLHQRFCAHSADPRILERHLARTPAPPLRAARLRGFLQHWAREAADSARDRPPVYLEWDRPGDFGGVGAPGVFLPIEHPGDPDAERDRRRAAAARHAADIDLEVGPVATAAIDLLSASLAPGASLNFVGFMVGRGTALRANVRGVRPADLPLMLDRIGWTGDRDQAAALFEQLVASSDRVIVGFDFAPGLQARIGFEIILDLPTDQDRRWAEIFARLVAGGLCDQAECDMLTALPAHIYPETGTHAWPTAWMVAAMRSPKHLLPWVERRISHLKLVIAADGAVSAKAYVSAEHHWLRGAERSPSRVTPSVKPPSVSAAERATAFLVAAQGQDDLWRDFSMPGPSDEWVTAFVGHVLTGIEQERAQQAVARSVQAMLNRQRTNGGWGYNGNCPPDADSTAWALRFLDAAGHAGPAMGRARSFLLSHRFADGTFATYAPGAPMRFDDRPWSGPSDGWTGRHLCVTANAVAALQGSGSGALTSAQHATGCWEAYWWRTDTFSTALAVEVLADNAAAKDGAVRWAREKCAQLRAPFDRAWLSRILSFGDAADREAARRLLIELAAEQEPDGGWAPGAELLLPHPTDRERGARTAAYRDLRRVFTTASVLSVLKVAQPA